jgi:hypothetical protein
LAAAAEAGAAARAAAQASNHRSETQDAIGIIPVDATLRIDYWELVIAVATH